MEKTCDCAFEVYLVLGYVVMMNFAFVMTGFFMILDRYLNDKKNGRL